ncbi:PAAR domain-containing protein [Paludibacterium purpuratum]|nr:PAAR domain-containing protein [Paludibacterium purpuratum]
MSKPVIRLGDPTSHGGYVVSASGTIAYGKQIACMGDRVMCPKPGHENCMIAEGSEFWKIYGRPAALDGHKTSCGAVLLSTCGEVTHDHEGGGAEAQAAAAALVRQYQARQEPPEQPHDEQFHLVDEHGNPHADTHFTAKLPTGEIVHGVTDSEGRTPRIRTDDARHVEIHLGHIEQ